VQWLVKTRHQQLHDENRVRLVTDCDDEEECVMPFVPSTVWSCKIANSNLKQKILQYWNITNHWGRQERGLSNISFIFFYFFCL
jgi:hypothetical protein